MPNLFWEIGRIATGLGGVYGGARSGGQQGPPPEPVKLSRIQELQEHLDRLTLACAAMWELLRDKAGVTEEELAAKMTEVDLRDGSQDGRIKAPLAQCPQCGRNISPRHRKCLFCGAENPGSSPFVSG